MGRSMASLVRAAGGLVFVVSSLFWTPSCVQAMSVRRHGSGLESGDGLEAADGQEALVAYTRNGVMPMQGNPSAECSAMSTILGYQVTPYDKVDKGAEGDTPWQDSDNQPGTAYMFNNGEVAWRTGEPIAAVLVKAGTKINWYEYLPQATNGGSLGSPKPSVSHVTFCKNPNGSPTERPTMSPTMRPTKSPTMRPTKSPTERPTMSPTMRATKSPTKRPTKSPTKRPTMSPTRSSPTMSPTMRATKSPTNLPPTASPTPRIGLLQNPQFCSHHEDCPTGNLCARFQTLSQTCVQICIDEAGKQDYPFFENPPVKPQDWGCLNNWIGFQFAGCDQCRAYTSYTCYGIKGRRLGRPKQLQSHALGEAIECKNRCCADSRCKGYTYEYYTGKCQLFRSLGGIYLLKGATSGTVDVISQDFIDAHSTIP